MQPQPMPSVHQPQFTVTADLYKEPGSKIDMYGGMTIVGVGTGIIAAITKHEAMKLGRAIRALH